MGYGEAMTVWRQPISTDNNVIGNHDSRSQQRFEKTNVYCLAMFGLSRRPASSILACRWSFGSSRSCTKLECRMSQKCPGSLWASLQWQSSWICVVVKHTCLWMHHLRRPNRFWRHRRHCFFTIKKIYILYIYTPDLRRGPEKCNLHFPFPMLLYIVV